MANLPDFRDQLSLHLLDSNLTNSPRYTPEFRDFAINLTYQEVISSFPFWFLDTRLTVPLVPGQNWISRPANINSIYRLFLGVETASKEIGELIMDQYYSMDTDGVTGDPTGYMISGDRIYFNSFPAAASNIVIVYRKMVDDLTDDSPDVVSGFDDQWLKMIPLGAAAYCLMTNRGSDLQNASYFENKYREKLALMKANYKRKQSGRPSQIDDYDTGARRADQFGYF